MILDLGKLLEQQRGHGSTWFWTLVVFLAALVGLNLVFHPHHPHFPGEETPGFWPMFGLGSALAMVLILKKIVAKLLGRPDDLYEDLSND